MLPLLLSYPYTGLAGCSPRDMVPGDYRHHGAAAAAAGDEARGGGGGTGGTADPGCNPEGRHSPGPGQRRGHGGTGPQGAQQRGQQQQLSVYSVLSLSFRHEI